VRRLPIEALRAAHQGWARAWDAHTAHRAAPRSPVWLAVLGALGVVLGAAVPLGLLPSGVGLVGAALAIGALLAAWIVHVRARSELPPQRPEDVARILEGMRVPADRLQSPAELGRLVDALARAQTRLEEAADALARAEALARGLEDRARELRAQCEWLGLTEDEDGGEVELASLLRSALAEARERAVQVERDRVERAQAERELASHRPVLERKRTHLARLERVLRANAPRSAELAAAYRDVRERGAGERFVRERERELRLDPRYERLGELGYGDEPSEADLDVERRDAEREAELTALEERIGHARERLGELGSRLGADPGSRQARARDEVVALETELAELERERDRLALLESIVSAAEREFRDAHQTDVLRRASAYLTRVTGGRYSRLDIDEGPDPDGGLLVTCAEREEPILVGPPLSRGTLDQIFLCLRVGLLDHLDEARERLPLVLDDALVRCDRGRRAEIYRLLADVSRERQVFLLTCHDHLADEACRELAGDQQELFTTASRIDLGR
jgi:uncharacterized protein YhaN